MTRATHRLEIARGLLHLPANIDVLVHIRALPQPRQEEIRSLVDWVEAYELEEQRLEKKL